MYLTEGAVDICGFRPFLKGSFLVIFLLPPLFSGNVEDADLRSREKLPHQYSIMEWTIDDGLPSNFIRNIIQTTDGFLWIATGRGLSRFDGVSFTTIDRKSFPILLSNDISPLLEDSEGNLWFGTYGGGLYKFQDDTLSCITDDMGLPSNYVLSLAEDSSGTIWVGTDGEGLAKILPDTLIRYSEADGLSRHVNALTVDQDNVLWVGTRNGIYTYHNGLFSNFHANDQLPSLTVFDLYAHEGTILVATVLGLASVNNGKVEYIHINGNQHEIRSVIQNQKGEIWIGTWDYGVYRISATSVANYVHIGRGRGGDVQTVMSDREGNIWIGTEQGGIVRLRDEVFTAYTEDDGLPNNFITSVTEGPDGKIWIGGEGGLTYLTGTEINMFDFGDLASDEMITSVYVDRKSTVWCGTRSGKLLKITDGQPSLVELPDMIQTAVYATYVDRSNALWIGTSVGLYHLENGDFSIYRSHDEGITNNDVRAIVEDNEGTIWIGTSYGLNSYSNGVFNQYTSSDGLSNEIIVSLHADADNDIWVGTFGGLNRFRDGRFTVLTSEHGLPDDAIANIIDDGYGYLWIGGRSGITRINKAELNNFLDGNIPSITTKVFGRSHGLKSDQIRITLNPSAWKAQDGTLWFATDEGVAMVNPSVIRPNPIAPPVQIISTRVDRTVKTGFRSISPLELSTDHNEIEISYAAPTFINPSNVAFMYKLEGLSTDWVDAGTRRSAYFSKLPPGDYTFRVIAANEDGIWNELGASLALVVLPPYWMTWWFRSMIVFLFLCTGPAIYFHRVSSLNKKHTQQQEFLMRLIDSQEAERKRIAADLHDSLGQNIIIIKNRALLGKKAGSDKEMLSEQLDEIERTATAALVDMRKISHNLRPFNLERFGLTETIAHSVKDADASSGIGFRTELDTIDNLLPPAHEIHLFRIVQEALNNILKHSEAASASVSITRESASLHLSVSDNGRGFDAAKDTPRRGIGLKDIEQRVSLIGGHMTIDSRPGNGTILTVIVPVSEKSS
jgi:signal transduction histidine kinase/ligand-binding sensor domain-containing protein